MSGPYDGKGFGGKDFGGGKDFWGPYGPAYGPIWGKGGKNWGYGGGKDIGGGKGSQEEEEKPKVKEVCPICTKLKPNLLAHIEGTPYCLARIGEMPEDLQRRFREYQEECRSWSSRFEIRPKCQQKVNPGGMPQHDWAKHDPENPEATDVKP